MPELIGGIQALGKAIVYPEDAKEEGVEGRVLLKFIVEKDGTVTAPTVVSEADPRLDAAALRAVQEISFKPGHHEGDAVRVEMMLPITFKLK